MALPLDGARLDQLLAYVELLAHWNRAYNLVAAADPETLVRRHVIDCLTAVGPVRRETAGRTPLRIRDVGSGAGLPGVVLAIMIPEVSVVCVDSVGKKAAFVRHVAADLHLANLQASNVRIEAWRGPPFELVTCRAFASLAAFVRLSEASLGRSGRWMAMKGKRPDVEIAQLPASIEVFHVEPLTVPGGGDGDRCLVWMRRQGEYNSMHTLSIRGLQ